MHAGEPVLRVLQPHGLRVEDRAEALDQPAVDHEPLRVAEHEAGVGGELARIGAHLAQVGEAPGDRVVACSAAPSCGAGLGDRVGGVVPLARVGALVGRAIARSTAASAARAFFSASVRSSEHGSENSRRSAESAARIRSALVAAAARRVATLPNAERTPAAARGASVASVAAARASSRARVAAARRSRTAARGVDPGRGLFGLGEPFGRPPRAGAGGVGRLHGRARGDQRAARLLHRHRQARSRCAASSSVRAWVERKRRIVSRAASISRKARSSACLAPATGPVPSSGNCAVVAR